MSKHRWTREKHNLYDCLLNRMCRELAFRPRPYLDLDSLVRIPLPR